MPSSSRSVRCQQLEEIIKLMTETAAKLEQAIEQVKSQYYRLVILAGALRPERPPPCSCWRKSLVANL